MKKSICILIILLITYVISAQDIGYAEYFVDTDPGHGKATKIDISVSASDLTLDFDVSTNSLANGWHFIGIRAKNSNGNWGLNCNRLMYILKLPATNDRKISKAEYFIDTDPGIGQANPITVNNQDFEVVLEATANLASLNSGMHYISIRSADISGRWGVQINRLFYYAKMQSSSSVSKAEYFIDTDLGFGKAKPFTVANPGNELTLDVTNDLAGLETGMHQIVIRAGDAEGRWGSSINRTFYFVKIPVLAEANITHLEYFYDSDPGFGKGIAISASTPGKEVSFSFDANLSGITSGNHIIYIRAKNALNQWGQVYTESFSYSITGLGDEKVVSWFKIYPNPNQGDFRIQFPENQNESSKIQILDISGKMILEKLVSGKSEEFSIDVPKGLYIINIEKNNKIFSQKLCIDW